MAVMMEVDERPLTDSKEEERDWPGRWDHVRKLLERRGPFAHPSFEPSPECLTFVRDACKLLVVGAGGLGCELLKDLALMGFKHIHVIDMDTIDISNLNRQFLFRQKDVGRSKAEVASEFINSRIPGTSVVAHDCKIQDKDESFYRKFHIIVCGLDSVVARRWINGMVISLLSYDEDGNLDQSTIIPIIDGGTEGFKGNARIIYPGITACIECTLDLFPPQINFPLCTIAHTPRLPEHCIEYVRVLQWAKENPFGGEDVAIDGDDPAHITWILDKALERAAQYNIRGVTYRLTQGVIKHIIAAVASTNGVVAAAMAMETFKVATSCANPLQNYMVFNQVDGIYTYSYEASRHENCLACNQKPRVLSIEKGKKLHQLLDLLTSQNGQYQMRSPGLTTTTTDGRHKTLYMQNVSSIEQVTRPNLKKTLEELGVDDGAELVVADVTTPNAIVFKVSFSDGNGIVGQE